MMRFTSTSVRSPTPGSVSAWFRVIRTVLTGSSAADIFLYEQTGDEVTFSLSKYDGISGNTILTSRRIMTLISGDRSIG